MISWSSPVGLQLDSTVHARTALLLDAACSTTSLIHLSYAYNWDQRALQERSRPVSTPAARVGRGPLPLLLLPAPLALSGSGDLPEANAAE